MTTLLIATRNAHKAAEIRAILGAQFKLLTLDDFPKAPRVLEDAKTFAGNATKKARSLANWLAGSVYFTSCLPRDFLTLADDSGLEADALAGAPGVHSARFAALDKNENSSDADNNAKLLRLLKDVPLEKRTARFRCVLALTRLEFKPTTPTRVDHVTFTETFDGGCEGKILFEPHGQNGFGYDPLFVPDGFTRTFAELGDEIKNKLSHRARALEKLKKYFNNQAAK
jgi:XTP/dITP diphosphohydrolase